MTAEDRQFLYQHIQEAIEIELSTIPIYLYTYYSIRRTNGVFPSTVSADRQNKLQLFANKAGGVIMSVAVEEMLHMSLASNLLRSLGGKPKIYGLAPQSYPTGLPGFDSAIDFKVGLEKLSSAQLTKFLRIEKPESKGASPECKNWETIGQFYDCIRRRILHHTTDADFGHTATQLDNSKAYFPNNVDTIYPDAVGYDPIQARHHAVYPNAKDSGGLKTIKNKADAIAAIEEICHQGEGYTDEHEFDDPKDKERTHWAKFKELYDELNDPKDPITEAELGYITYDFYPSPTHKTFGSVNAAYIDLCNGVFSYLLLMTEAIYKLRGTPQAMMMDIGMHKGMIFVLDKIIGDMRAVALTGATNGPVLSPTFHNYKFKSIATAKQELITLFNNVNENGAPGQQILQRIQDLPDVNIQGVDSVIRF